MSAIIGGSAAETQAGAGDRYRHLLQAPQWLLALTLPSYWLTLKLSGSSPGVVGLATAVSCYYGNPVVLCQNETF